MLRSASPYAILAGLVAFGPGGALAAGDDQSGRYSLAPTEGGFVRLDRETGAMSFCTGKEGDWACKPMADAENKLKARVGELEAENKALREQKSAETEPPPPVGALPDSVPPAPPGDLPVPTEKDVDKLFDYVEGMMKKFKERIKRLEREAQKEETPL